MIRGYWEHPSRHGFFPKSMQCPRELGATKCLVSCLLRSGYSLVITYSQINFNLLSAGIPVSLEVLLKLSHLVFHGWPLDSTKVLKSQTG